MRLLLFPLLAVFLLAFTSPASAEAGNVNPLTGTGVERAEPAKQAIPLITTIKGFILDAQRQVNRRIATQMRAIKKGETAGALLTGMVLAFLYGALHTLGPGHGKMVVISYFISREARIGRGLLMGIRIAVAHVISAIVLVSLVDLMLSQFMGRSTEEVRIIKLISYAIISGIGIAMLVQSIRHSLGLSQRQSCCHEHGGHGHDHGENRRQGILSICVGLVPCTGAILIMLYALANDIVLAGAILVCAIAIGMAAAMALLGVLSILARKAVLGRLTKEEGKPSRLSIGLEYAGAVVIILIGFSLFAATYTA